MATIPLHPDAPAIGRYFFHLDPHLPRQVTMGRERRAAPTYSWRGLERHGGPFGLVQYTLRGRGVLERGGVRHVVEAGQAFLVEIPDDHHYYLPAGSAPWEFVYLMFTGADALHHLHWIIEQHGSVLTLGDDHPALAEVSALATALQSEPLDTPEALGVWLYRVVLALRHGLPAGGAAPPAPLARALQHLEAHFAQDLGVEALAQAAGLSRAHFVRTFTRQVGISPHAYLLRRRLRHALYLLESTRLPMEEVALQCGFAGASYFGKAFRRVLGLTPLAYRAGERTAMPVEALVPTLR